MTPSITDYLNGLRRLWWVPLGGLLIGLGLSVFVTSGAKPAVTTTGYVLFTYRVTDQGQDSAGSARSAEADVAKARLAGYVQLALSSQPIQEALASHGIDTPPTTSSPTTGQPLDDSAPLMIAPIDGGVVQVRLNNESLSQTDATEVVKTVSNEVARTVLATDSLQASPSMRSDPVVTEPVAIAGSVSLVKLLLPTLLLFLAGLAVAYGVIWAQGRVWSGRDIEERLGATLLGDVGGIPAEGLAVALALKKDRVAPTRAVLVPVGTMSPAEVDIVGKVVADAWSQLGRPGSLRSSDTTAEPSSRDASDDFLEVVVGSHGLDATALQAASAADVVGLIVCYGRGRYRDLTSAGRALAKVTDAEIAIIGLKRGRSTST